MLRSAFLLGLVATAGCLPRPGFQCEGDDQCVAQADGRCESDNWCSYPDDECPSQRAYGAFARPGVALTCVAAETATSGSTGADDGETLDTEGQSTGSESGEEQPVLCGNGSVDPGETCDDGNRVAGDGCHPLCVEPGTPSWTATYDGEAFGNDRGFGVTVDATRDAVYLIGITTASDPDTDILVQRRSLETGALVWSQAIDGGVDGDDVGEHGTISADGNLVVAGRVQTANGDSDGWIAKLAPSGDQLWSQTHGSPEGDDRVDGIATMPDGSLVAVGTLAAAGRVDAWIQRYDESGAPTGAPIVRGDQPGSNIALDVIPTPTGFQVTGNLGIDPETQNIWTASYTSSGTELWQDLISADDVGNVSRGVGQAVDPLGGTAVAGVLFNDILLQRYTADGERASQVTFAGDRDAHDEAADIAFSADGSFILVGFVDFATTGFATGDIWVRRHTASGEEIWTDTIEGEAEEIDKALAVAITTHESAVVTGYVTVPGQSRDVWVRRYAL